MKIAYTVVAGIGSVEIDFSSGRDFLSADNGKGGCVAFVSRASGMSRGGVLEVQSLCLFR